jgi:AraC family transcriptional regulator, regulatory protein of adaptative response / methylated-DNA-[protein]-cysteine methyltransferase
VEVATMQPALPSVDQPARRSAKARQPERQLHLALDEPAHDGRGMRISYSIVGSPLGKVLVAFTARGVCAVHLGDDERVLVAELGRDYRRAAIAPSGPGAGPPSPTMTAVSAALEGRPSEPVELDLRGSHFQRRVWDEVRRVPRGATTTYLELAHELGRPTAARAVARAVATNPVALLIPCHRVVRSDGGLADYRWGIERKREVLERERALATTR